MREYVYIYTYVITSKQEGDRLRVQIAVQKMGIQGGKERHMTAIGPDYKYIHDSETKSPRHRSTTN